MFEMFEREELVAETRRRAHIIAMVMVPQDAGVSDEDPYVYPGTANSSEQSSRDHELYAALDYR